MDPDRPIVRWSLLVLWAVVAVMLYEPVVALFGWPFLLLALAGGVVWTAKDFVSLRHQAEPLRTGRALVRVELVVTAIALVTCGYLATAGVMRGRDSIELSLSTSFAPSLLAIVFVMVLRAIQAPTPRRIAVVSMGALGAFPLLAAVKILAVPSFGLEDELRIVAPDLLTAYAICTLVIGALGIHLGITARTHGYGDEIPAEPPRARVAS